MMNGEISVDSIYGEGSVFKFNVKLKIAMRASEHKIILENLHGINILIVDDNENNRKSIGSYFQGSGIKIFEAKDATNAITTVLSNANTKDKISIVIMDYQMPDMSGYELATTLRTIPFTKDVKLVLLTSVANKGESNSAEQYGFSCSLVKPVKRDDLLRSIEVMLGLKKEDKEEKHILIKNIDKNVNMPPNSRILLVDDNDMNRKIVINMLKQRNMTCDEAVNGEDALKAVLEKDYDVVFMDCQMPIMDGYECASKIRLFEGEKKHTTIIAMTANAMEGDYEKCIQAGMDDYISKPIDFDLMFNKIEINTQEKEEVLNYNNIVNNSIDHLIESTGLSKADAVEIMEDFMKYLPDLIKGIGEAINNNDFNKLAKLSHELKGSSGTFRINSIYELAIKLEKEAKEQEIKECTRIYNEIKALCR
jgi:Response regulator containing a CheY-like receiver domain and a GGDEF domain